MDTGCNYCSGNKDLLKHSTTKIHILNLTNRFLICLSICFSWPISTVWYQSLSILTVPYAVYFRFCNYFQYCSGNKALLKHSISRFTFLNLTNIFDLSKHLLFMANFKLFGFNQLSILTVTLWIKLRTRRMITSLKYLSHYDSSSIEILFNIDLSNSTFFVANFNSLIRANLCYLRIQH